MNKLWLNISFLYFLIIAIIGITLRLMGLIPINLNYAYLLHTHSHLAFLGWIYNILFTILIYTFLSSENRNKKIYHHLFWITQVANVGMLLSYPVQGYGLYSISFSTLHILCSWAFVYYFLKDAKANSINSIKGKISFAFINAAMFFMVISALGPFSMAPISKITGAGSSYYYNTIYLYLHFQYNGWFIFSVLGLFFRTLENNQIAYNQKFAKLFYTLLMIACVPAYFLSTLWSKPVAIIYIISSIAAIMQLVAVLYFLLILKSIKTNFNKNLNKWVKFLFYFSFICFVIKNILQFVGAIPAIADIAYEIHNFIIGYLHIIFLGVISFFVFAYLINEKELLLSKTIKVGLFLLITGFIFSEIIIFTQGVFILLKQNIFSNYFEYIFYFSLPMLIGIGLIVIDRFFLNYHSEKQTEEHFYYKKPLSAKL
ncbi:MAG: hypothetical protein LC122_11070 [Chitinophagales bacterium]|nr:hypothetical protein [Chitinophagales bacterium]